MLSLKSFLLSLLLIIMCAYVIAQDAAARDPLQPDNPTQEGPPPGWVRKPKIARSEQWSMEAPWEMSSLSVGVYVFSSLVFAAGLYYYMNTPQLAITADIVPTPILFAALVPLPYLAYQVYHVLYDQSLWFSFTGKLFNYVWVLYMPYRVLLPVTGSMVEYSKGKGSAQLRKTIKVVVSIGMDVALTAGLLFMVLRYFNPITLLFVLGTFSGSVFAYKVLQWRGVRRSTVFEFLQKASKFLPLLCVVFFILEVTWGAMPVLYAVHGYACIALLLAQIWVIKISSTDVAETSSAAAHMKL